MRDHPSYVTTSTWHKGQSHKRGTTVLVYTHPYRHCDTHTHTHTNWCTPFTIWQLWTNTMQAKTGRKHWQVASCSQVTSTKTAYHQIATRPKVEPKKVKGTIVFQLIHPSELTVNEAEQTSDRPLQTQADFSGVLNGKHCYCWLSCMSCILGQGDRDYEVSIFHRSTKQTK